MRYPFNKRIPLSRRQGCAWILGVPDHEFSQQFFLESDSLNQENGAPDERCAPSGVSVEAWWKSGAIKSGTDLVQLEGRIIF
jgi:hypothetical protein